MAPRLNRKAFAQELAASRKQDEALTARARNVCPDCGSTKCAGLMAAFFVSLNSDGDPEGQWIDWQSNTELGPMRMCSECGQEWESDE